MSHARTTIDTIIQGCTVELFHHYGLALAPLDKGPAGTNTDFDCLGIIGFEAGSVRGRLSLAIPEVVFRRQSDVSAQHPALEDWTRELTNQLMGRIKHRLLQFQLPLRTHLPSALSRAAAVQQKTVAGEIAYPFRALRGTVVVTVDASLAAATLRYSNGALAAPVDELILL
jgi:hypothetical protein